MQIGHQLADVHIAQWVRLLAEKAVATDWNCEKNRDTMQSALLDMPPHVQVLFLNSRCISRDALHYSTLGIAMLCLNTSEFHMQCT